MHKTPFHHASRIFAALATLTALLAFTGCATLRITNLTPETVPANPSQIYTITASVHLDNSSLVPDSIKVRIVIDGQNYPMVKNIAGSDIWEFDYQLPAGRTNASYYFLVNYTVNVGGGTQAVETQSESLQSLNIAGRYVLRAEASRAPVGSRVSVLGAGFTPNDVVLFDVTPTRTVFESPSSVSFFVPAVEPGRSYQVRLAGGGTELPVGSFRVDVINLSVSPSELTLHPGEQQALTFTIAQPAAAGGMLVAVTTDVPSSIIMPEVMIAAGQTSVTVPVQGGKPGTGSLFFKSSAGEVKVAVTVK